MTVSGVKKEMEANSASQTLEATEDRKSLTWTTAEDITAEIGKAFRKFIW